MKTWLVWIHNLVDSRDDEVWRVRAASYRAMYERIERETHMRYGIGEIIPARSKNVRTRRRAAEFREYCTRTLR